MVYSVTQYKLYCSLLFDKMLILQLELLMWSYLQNYKSLQTAAGSSLAEKIQEESEKFTRKHVACCGSRNLNGLIENNPSRKIAGAIPLNSKLFILNLNID